MKSPQDASPESWHRFFGASANNTAWMELHARSYATAAQAIAALVNDEVRDLVQRDFSKCSGTLNRTPADNRVSQFGPPWRSTQTEPPDSGGAPRQGARSCRHAAGHSHALCP